MWVLGTESRSSTRAASASNSRAICLALSFLERQGVMSLTLVLLALCLLSGDEISLKLHFSLCPLCIFSYLFCAVWRINTRCFDNRHFTINYILRTQLFRFNFLVVVVVLLD